MKEHIEEMARAICGLNTSDGCFCYGGYCNYNCLSYEKAEALYNAGYRKQEWISVEDRLPEDADERVLVYIVSERSYTELDTDRFVGGRWVRWGNDVTHWMPLPEPPKMKGGAE